MLDKKDLKSIEKIIKIALRERSGELFEKYFLSRMDKYSKEYNNNKKRLNTYLRGS